MCVSVLVDIPLLFVSGLARAMPRLAVSTDAARDACSRACFVTLGEGANSASIAKSGCYTHTDRHTDGHGRL